MQLKATACGSSEYTHNMGWKDVSYGRGIYIYEMILYAERTCIALHSHLSRQNRSSVRDGANPILLRAVT